MQPIHYFAYGSNMLRARLEKRGVVVLDAGRPAQVSDYDLVFNKKSNDVSSKANLIATPGVATWGILFSVKPDSLAGLDKAEGAPDHYYRSTVTVRTLEGEFVAMTYLAQPNWLLTVADQPWDWYLALILAGAKACPGMPPEWIERLRRTFPSKPYTKQPPNKSFIEAVTQLKAAGHHRWQNLLISETESNL